ncbi:hypothetical protein [Pseudomonas typographi]|uniref:hypothetical protein n=1 Tax=Pseudomonas typographi TaxID=2715964 RepID=UPI001682AF02|nr:hypothetical protein [Pseudomonas typographi]MBD1589496.1 hypothetical protein [Pseudomonas typographi]
MSAQTELAVMPPKEKALQVFQTPKGLDPYLQVVRDKIDAFVPDVTTRKGREAIASIAYQVARSKTALDNRGKELVAELKEIPKLIDAERKRVRDTLDAWQEEVRRPLNEWQAAEHARIEKHNSMIRHIEDCGLGLIGGQPQPFALLFRELEEKVIVDEKFEEFEAEAHRAKASALAKLKVSFDEHQKREAEQAELARLRAEQEAREQREHEERIAREAAERARLEAEQKAQAEREATIRREQEAKAAAERRELELKLQAEQAERAAAQAEANRIAAEQRAAQEREESARRAEQAAEQARLAEQRRQQAEAAEVQRQQQAREADKAHKGAIYKVAKEAFMQHGMTEECARLAVKLIASNFIPAVKIEY